jgi:hypothetical protein
MVLLCSDGLSDMIDDATIQTSIENYTSQLQSAVNDLINKANQAGGRDNITSLLLRIPGKSKTAALTTARLPRYTPATTTNLVVPAAAATVTTPIPVPEERRSRLPILLAVGGLFVLLPIVIVIVLLATQLLGGPDTDSTDPTLAPDQTAESGTLLPTSNDSGGPTHSAATLSILDITNQAQGTPTIANSTDITRTNPTPALRPTNTNTPTRISPTRTPIPTETTTGTPSPSPLPPTSPGGGGPSETDTPAPQATNTSAPPPTSTLPKPTETPIIGPPPTRSSPGGER